MPDRESPRNDKGPPADKPRSTLGINRQSSDPEPDLANQSIVAVQVIGDPKSGYRNIETAFGLLRDLAIRRSRKAPRSGRIFWPAACEPR